VNHSSGSASGAPEAGRVRRRSGSSMVVFALTRALGLAGASQSSAVSPAHEAAVAHKAAPKSGSYWTDARIGAAVSRAIPLTGNAKETAPAAP